MTGHLIIKITVALIIIIIINTNILKVLDSKTDCNYPAGLTVHFLISEIIIPYNDVGRRLLRNLSYA